MAYSTGVASSFDDFIAQLISFAVANAGFADAGVVTTSAGTGSKNIRRVSKGGVYWNFIPYTDDKGVRAAMSYSGFPSGFAAPGPGAAIGLSDAQYYYTEMNSWNFTGPFAAHYFFTDGTCVHAVLEVASNIFNHISFGSVSKYGAWTGGEYVTAGWYGVKLTATVWRAVMDSYHTRPFNDFDAFYTQNRISTIRAAGAGVTADFQGVTSPYVSGYGVGHGMFVGSQQDTYAEGSLYGRLLRDAPNETTNRTPIFPGLLRLYDAASDLSRLAGSIPYVGILKMQQDMNPKDIINTDWQVFPITMRDGGDETLASNSFSYALAYRRI